MKTGTVRLFQTLDHPCGYFDDRSARNLVIDPLDPRLPAVYETALAWGFRRAGGHVYRPQCRHCQACVPCRIPVEGFAPDRGQRRCLRRNQDLAVSWRRAEADPELMGLYERYLAWRHPGGGMDEPAPDDFRRFLISPWNGSEFLEARLDGRLVAVAVTDIGRNCLSAVYTFYAPDQARRSLGLLCILKQLERARAQDLAHLYLGYWIPGHPKMHYKSKFSPIEVLRRGRWQALLRAESESRSGSAAAPDARSAE
jgi:arginyl-tRNA--protein-N-Asp/Glu arginylyltransferase